MWKPNGFDNSRGSYEIARSEDEGSDDMTLADEGDITMAEESTVAKANGNSPYLHNDLVLDDDLDKRSDLDNPIHPSSPRWADLTQRMAWWKPRSGINFAEPGTPRPEKSEDTASLLGGTSESPPRWVDAGRETVSWLVWPLPSYTHQFFVKNPYREETRRETDYLDGLRGVASLFVFFGHYLAGGKHDVKDIHYGFGYDESNSNVFQLPFIRTIYSGSAMVSIFFVISGYVLSQQCILSMRAGKQDKLHTALTSMTFRRAIRLFLPSIIISALALACVFLGLLEPQHPKNWNWAKELGNFWFHINKDLFKVFDWDISFHHWYSPPLWTIPIEFRCSMILFLFILAVARCKANVRFLVEVLTIWWLFYTKRWDVALFIAGMVIAELNIFFDERKKQREETDVTLGNPDMDMEMQTSRRKRAWFNINISHIPLWLMLGLGWFLSGYPEEGAMQTPGYAILTKFSRDDLRYTFRFWLAQSAILIVGSISFLPAAKAFFSTPIARYLGKISYALYLVHALLNMTLRFFLWNTFWNALQYESEEGHDAKFEGGWILGSLIYIPIVLWAADVFWRAADAPTVSFAKWLEGKCFVKGKA